MEANADQAAAQLCAEVGQKTTPLSDEYLSTIRDTEHGDKERRARAVIKEGFRRYSYTTLNDEDLELLQDAFWRNMRSLYSPSVTSNPEGLVHANIAALAYVNGSNFNFKDLTLKQRIKISADLVKVAALQKELLGHQTEIDVGSHTFTIQYSAGDFGGLGNINIFLGESKSADPFQVYTVRGSPIPGSTFRILEFQPWIEGQTFGVAAAPKKDATNRQRLSDAFKRTINQTRSDQMMHIYT